MAIQEYDPRKNSISWLGADITGVADGTYITITPNADLATYTVGAQGDSACSINPDLSATVEITLLQNSPDNLTLTAILNKFHLGTSDFPTGAMVIRDPSAPFIPILEGVRLQARPTYERAQEQVNVVWRFHAAKYTQLEQTSASSEYLSKFLAASTALDALSDLLS